MATPTSFSASRNRLPTSTAQDPTASSIRTPSASTSSKPAVSPPSSRLPRTLAWVGSSHLPPAVSTPSPFLCANNDFGDYQSAYEHLGFSPGYPAIRGRHRRTEPRRRIALQPSPRPLLYPSPRPRIASQPSPRPPLRSRPYHRLASPLFHLSTLRSRTRRGTA